MKKKLRQRKKQKLTPVITNEDFECKLKEIMEENIEDNIVKQYDKQQQADNNLSFILISKEENKKHFSHNINDQ
jgi:hypothetical protein